MSWREMVADREKGLPVEQKPSSGWREMVSSREMPKTSQSQEPIEDLSLKDRAIDFFTGNKRKTAVTEKLPELQDSGLLRGEELGLGFKSALLTMTDPNEIAQAITTQYPNIVVTHNKDGQGNVFPILTNRETGAATVINKPGVSGIDVLQTLGLGAAFFPSSKAVAGTTALGKAMSVGTQAAATQGAIEVGQEVAGGNFNTGDVVLAGAGGAVFERVGTALANAAPAVKQQIRNGVITEKVRKIFQREAKQLGVPEDSVNDNVIRMWAQRPDDRTGLEREFDVTLSNAQRSGNQADLREEDMFRSGARGDKAQQVFLSEETKQSQALTDAAGGLQEQIGGDSPLVTSRQQAGSALREGVQAAERVADEAIDEAYANVGDAVLSPEGFRELLKATRQATDSIEYPKTEVPGWQGLQDTIIRSEKTLRRLSQKGNVTLKPVHINQIESIRKAINNTIDTAKNPADMRNIMAMKNAFNDYLDKAVIRGMFDGDQESLSALKSARGVFADYMNKFGTNTKRTRLGSSKDQAGEFIKKVILEDPTNEQMVNSLFSVTGLSKQGASKLAQRYKQILGSDSNEWNMVRQAAFDHLVAKKNINGVEYVDGSKTYKNIVNAQNVNKSLIDELFSKDEWNTIKRFASISRKTVPELVKSRANPSGSATTLMREAHNKLMSVLPFVDLGMSAAAGGGFFFKNARNAAKARGAFRPFSEKGVIRRASQSQATGASPELLDEPVNLGMKAASAL